MSDETPTQQSSEIPVESSPSIPVMPPPPSRGKAWVVRILLGLLIFSCGAVFGGAVTLRVASNRISANLQHPEQVPEKAGQRLKHALDLDESQFAEVKTILQKRLQNISTMRREIGPRMEEELNALRDEISAVLRPDQVERWQKLFDNQHARLLPFIKGPGRGPGAPRPPR